ncbi:MAG: hypothetical protein ABI700_06715 [Chloroflexota bacterium]
MTIDPLSEAGFTLSLHQETPFILELTSSKFTVSIRQETPLIHEAFSNAKLKVIHANEQIANLNAVLDALVPTDFYRRDVRHDSDTGHYIVEVRCLADPPDSIALIIGDTVHALRSALDHLIWEMVSRTGVTPDQNLYFPIGKTRKKFKEAIKAPQIQAIGKDMLDLIRNDIKPYPKGNDLLCALAQLDIIDKHKLLIPVFPSVQFSEDEQFDASKSPLLGMHIPKGFVWSIDAHSTEPREVNNNLKMRLQVVFGKEQPFEDEEVIPTLRSLSQLVEGIIQDVENAYRARFSQLKSP